jgi:pseudouridine-5'-phosphate glycosidase
MLEIRPDVATALHENRPVVALESTLIAHGLPWPINAETARAAEAVVRDAGAIPATIAVLNGKPTIGLTDVEIADLAQNRTVRKASRRDLPSAIVQRQTAATTVSATMALAHRAGIRVFATGGIGGVHRGAELTFDISADLTELARTPVAVVCAGAKSILDIPKTLELLETLGVPVIGFGTDTFPAFYLQCSGIRLTTRTDSASEAARIIQTHFDLSSGGVLLAQPVAAEFALAPAEFESALAAAERQVGAVTGQAVTPALLSKLAEVTQGKTLRANRDLIVANAKLAAQVACELVKTEASFGFSP